MPFPVVLDASFRNYESFGLRSVGVMLWLGIGVNVVALTMSNTAVRLVGANKASMLNYVRSALAAILAIALLGETFHPYHGVALLLVIAGVYLMTQGRNVGVR